MNKNDTKKTTGQIVRIKTMAEGSCRIEIDIPREYIPDDIIKWQFANVAVVVIENAE